jgi:putative transposase
MSDGNKRNTGTNQEEADSPESRDDRGAYFASRKDGKGFGDLSHREHQSSDVLSLEIQVQGSWDRGFEEPKARSEAKGCTTGINPAREREIEDGPLRGINRASTLKKKRELGLHGNLKGRHLSSAVRKSLLSIIDECIASGETLEEVCRVLEINRRAVYRWRDSSLSAPHGGGGGQNKVTQREEKKVVRLAKKFPQFRCRRIAYELERNAIVFIGKTKVAEIMKAHGLNHEFVRGQYKQDVEPADMLMHEPWKKNLLWGADWTWVHVNGKFMYLLVLLDWYSRKILAWGLFHQITSLEVVAVVTDAVAIEDIEKLPINQMRPRLVLDHGSANISKQTRANVEIQGLEIWLSGVGRPTGNARTERVIGTLKHEEIKLQPEYASESEALSRIRRAINDYNFRRPNSGVGGFAPNSVHHMGRSALCERRAQGRQNARKMRIFNWKQETQIHVTTG